MKARHSFRDQTLELSIYANGQQLQEYVLPNADIKQNILECFVPVQEGQQLTLKGKFEGKCLKASFDLVVDGSFLADARIEDKGSKPRTRKFDFERVYDCPAEKEGWNSKVPPIDVYEANMYVEDIGELVDLSKLEKVDHTKARPGVGSIQVVANVQDFEGEERADREWDMHGSGWLRRHKQAVRSSGIKPDCAVEVRHSSEEKVQQKRAKIHRNHGREDPQYGIKPWARIIFYYRKQASIDAAGCSVRTDDVRELKRYDRELATPLDMYDAVRSESPGLAVGSDDSLFAETNKPKLSRLGGDFRSQLLAQPQPLRQASARHASEGSVGAAENFGLTMESDDQDSLFVSEHIPPSKHRSLLTASKTHLAANKHTSRTPTPDPNDMSNLDHYLDKLPSLDQVANLIGITGSSSLEISKQFNKIATENRFPANGSVRNKLKSEYNLLVKKVANIDTGADTVTLKKKYIPRVINQEDEEEDTIELMPKQQNNKPPPAPMVAHSIEKPRSAMPSPAVSDRTSVLKRIASKSSTPDTVVKKARLEIEDTPELVAARRRIEENDRETEKLMKELEAKQAKKAARKARKAAAKQQEAKEREEQEKREASARALKVLHEEERAQKARIEALKAAAGDDDDGDDDEESEDDEDEDYDETRPDVDAYADADAAAETEQPHGGDRVETKADADADSEAESEED